MTTDYDNALERARKSLKVAEQFDYDQEDIAHAIRTTVYDVFPELKESEDERIRKWIVDELKDSLHNIEALYSGDYDNRDKDDMILEDCLRKALSWLEKQGEQNLANSAKTCKDEQNPAWSEEDDINLGKAIWYVENPAPMVVKDSMLVEWLKSLKERYTWKPAE